MPDFIQQWDRFRERAFIPSDERFKKSLRIDAQFKFGDYRVSKLGNDVRPLCSSPV
jgi:hypothetical protein